MPLTWNEIRQRAIAFARDWEDVTKENAEAQTFWNDFFHVFGRRRRTVASFEEAVTSVAGTAHRIDVFWSGRLIGEHKSRLPGGQNLAKAHAQANGYIADLVNTGRAAEVPQYIIVSDFHRIAIHNLEADDPDQASVEFLVTDLHQSENLRRFGFIAGYDQRPLDPEDPANIEAAELLATLHDALEDGGYTGHNLQRFMVRVLFCLFAEDTEAFDPNIFTAFIENHTAADGNNLGPQLAHLFQILNTPHESRPTSLNEDLAAFPFVNGELFAENLNITAFDSDMRTALLQCCRFKWDTISPAIFGSLFQSIMDDRERRQIGAHYTSERDILKLIRSLFLDQLEADFEKARKTSKPELRRFHDRLAALNFLDPACGCGNFLVIAYRELRDLEIRILQALHPTEGLQTRLGFDLADQLKVQVSQMHGIEIEEWPARIAEVALWLLDHQMNLKVSATFGQLVIKLPLRHTPHIVHANALQTDWRNVLPPEDCSFVMGNPPFIGKKEQTKEQKTELLAAWHPLKKGVSNLDYVSAWYVKTADYLATNTQAPEVDEHGRSSSATLDPRRAAFVSTNSITQGEQVGIIWPELFKRNIQIDFAHRTFPWESEARGKAHVHVVIVGFGHGNIPNKQIHDYGKKGEPLGVATAANISPYLTDGSNLTIANISKPINAPTPINYGSFALDDGLLTLSPEEAKTLIQNEPNAEPFIRRFIGARELLQGHDRFCLWLKDVQPQVLRSMPGVIERVEGVRNWRLSRGRETTVKLAATPGMFAEIRQPSDRYCAIPTVSSERRDYIPMAYLGPEVIASNQIYVLPGATLYHFGILQSAMQMAWVRQVCGRLESRYRYSARLVYNNFPWPDAQSLKAEQQAKVEAAAQQVLEVRAKYQTPDKTSGGGTSGGETSGGGGGGTSGGATLADLYDPLAMPADLAKAHGALDRAVDRCYRPRGQPFPDERRRFEFLFDRYEHLTATLMAPRKPSKRKKRSRG